MIYAPYICTHFVFCDNSNSNEYLQRYSPSKALSRAVDRAILVSEIGVNLKFLLGSFFLNKNFFFDKRWFLHPILAHLLSFMTNPIPMNTYRVVARQKLRFPTFFQILGVKPVFCEQKFFLIKDDFGILWLHIFCLSWPIQFWWIFIEL